MLVGQKVDRPNITFKYWVVKVPKGSSYAYGTFFKNNTGNVLLDDINEDYAKTITSGVWKPYKGDLSSTNTKEFTFTKKLWIPYKKLLKFGPGDGVITHNDDDIYFMLAPYDAYGTLQTDNIAYVSMFSEVYYRDP